jgi:hypothetical protein
MKGGKTGAGRPRPKPKDEPTSRKVTKSASRGSPKRDYGAIEREVPVRAPDSKPPKRK